MARKMQYLLSLEGPCYTIPIKLFPSEKALLEWASENPPIAENGSDVGDRAYGLVESAAGPSVDPEDLLDDGGNEANRKPFGYSVQRFDSSGDALGYATVEPYTHREPLLPGEAAPTSNIDPHQELNFS